MRSLYLLFFICSFGNIISQAVNAQDNLEYKLSILTQSSRELIDGYAYHYEQDTLWLVSNFGPIKPNATIDPYPANEIVSLWLPTGIKRKSRVGPGIGYGAIAGLATALISTRSCRDTPSSFCDVVNSDNGVWAVLLGSLTGGVVGIFIRKNYRQADRFIIRGNPELLRERKADIERLSKHVEELTPVETPATQ